RLNGRVWGAHLVDVSAADRHHVVPEATRRLFDLDAPVAVHGQPREHDLRALREGGGGSVGEGQQRVPALQGAYLQALSDLGAVGQRLPDAIDSLLYLADEHGQRGGRGGLGTAAEDEDDREQR